MRKLVAGIDANGRSCIVEEIELVLEPSETPGFSAAVVNATTQAPPPARPAGRGMTVDLGVPPGHVRWTILECAPETQFPSHHSDTVDHNMVLDGTMSIGLDDGLHRLEAGDVIVVNGVDHSWVAGPEGCRVSVTSIGSTPFASPASGGE